MSDQRAFVLQQLDEQWQKIAAVLVYKFSRDKPVIISHRDFEEFAAYMAADDKHLLTWGHYDSFEFRILPRAEAERLAAHVESIGGTAEKPT